VTASYTGRSSKSEELVSWQASVARALKNTIAGHETMPNSVLQNASSRAATGLDTRPTITPGAESVAAFRRASEAVSLPEDNARTATCAASPHQYYHIRVMRIHSRFSLFYNPSDKNSFRRCRCVCVCVCVCVFV
jgi:hypothetical protein